MVVVGPQAEKGLGEKEAQQQRGGLLQDPSAKCYSRPAANRKFGLPPTVCPALWHLERSNAQNGCHSDLGKFSTLARDSQPLEMEERRATLGVRATVVIAHQVHT